MKYLNTLDISCPWSEHILFMKKKIGLNIFYSIEQDWARHTTRQCPLQKKMIGRGVKRNKNPPISCHLLLYGSVKLNVVTKMYL